MIKYSEIFTSFQGEGMYTGTVGVWFRFFGCSLQCDGFGQKDPTDKGSYVLPYKNLDVSKYDKFEDLPVFDYGCDSSYSWSSKYKHLVHSNTVSEICEKFKKSLTNKHNPEGLFQGSETNNYNRQHLFFTGGEPLLKRNQVGILDIIEELAKQENLPASITIETNGTKILHPDFFERYMSIIEHNYIPLFFSVSPKLFSVSGEPPDKAIKPEAVKSYCQTYGQFKFVVNGTKECWDELERTIEIFKNWNITYPIYLMPVGATKEQQESNDTEELAREIIARGYNFSGRLHCAVFGNKIGT